MRYEDFLDLGYTPGEDDLICRFHLEVDGMPFEKAAGGVAAESSVGTWTEISTFKSYVERLHATVFEINGPEIGIAYPIGLFEPGNMPNILSSVAGNVFGLKEVTNLRLNDIIFPRKLAASFKGPAYGIQGVRSLLGVRDRPLIGTIVKPKLGLNTADHAEVAYEAWRGGCDIVKDDENLAGQSFNPFEDRVVKTLEARDRAEEETGERKVYMANVTSETETMLRRAEFIEEQGGRYLMVDILTAGWSALQTLRDQDFKLVIHAHRAGHAALTKSPRHGIAMPVIAKISRLIGVDQLHVGAAVGKMTEGKEEVAENIEACTEEMHGIRPVLPVASGGVYPGLVPEMNRFFGRDFVCQAGGGIHGHPEGTAAGALAMRQAVEACLQKTPLKEYARDHRELALALEKWGEI
ncbi:MAG: type III ribulose-bisphosphate carboxylase [Methanobacteriota archaeon]|nr:MAG: type III ribulose-bisphosphate carboxylase [Euryarchaeota archaeon]